MRKALRYLYMDDGATYLYDERALLVYTIKMPHRYVGRIDKVTLELVTGDKN
jgi:hypothetical protein